MDRVKRTWPVHDPEMSLLDDGLAINLAHGEMIRTFLRTLPWLYFPHRGIAWPP
ncbi:hypothetical protein [Echinicola rosea]|uniref:hypothetical protein n=1 Tax=Echinicola rosea TaxID=1807691 RepID=UPI0016510119|nr:hypothetical protein [Echinicola rosea]